MEIPSQFRPGHMQGPEEAARVCHVVSQQRDLTGQGGNLHAGEIIPAFRKTGISVASEQPALAECVEAGSCHGLHGSRVTPVRRFGKRI